MKRLAFPDAVVDQLSIADSVTQNILLYQLKSTFKHVINPNGYHLLGLNGVGVATNKITSALATGEYHYFIRMDIKSFYASIPRYKLIQDLKALYDDGRVKNILERIIESPIELPIRQRLQGRTILCPCKSVDTLKMVYIIVH